MRKTSGLALMVCMVMLTSACSNKDKTNASSSVGLSSSLGTSSMYSEVIMSFQSEHEGLVQVDLILDEVGYGLTLYFGTMEWDEFDNVTRVATAKSALEYALAETEEYTDRVVTYHGYTSDRKLIIFNDSSFHIVVMDTDGSNIYGTDIFPQWAF